MKKLFLLPFLFCFAACATVEFVRKDTSPKKQAVVRHSPASTPEKEAKYREEVAKKANEFCGSSGFDITKEYQAREESGSTGVSTGLGVGMGGAFSIGAAHRNTSMSNYVEFTCR